MMRMLIWWKAAGLVTLAAVLAAGIQQSPSFRARTDLVALNVTVFDDKGIALLGLGQDAFTLREDGALRPVEHFASGEIPLSIVIALDASESMKGERFDVAREAVSGFLELMGPNDELTVIGFNDVPFNIAPWSANRDTILEALAHVQPHGSTALYAAVSAAVDALRGSRNRKQAVVIVSDGNDQLRGEPPSRSGVNAAIRRQRALPALEHVQHSETLVYAIGVDAAHVVGPYRLDVQALRDLTDPSGGSTQIVDSDRGIATAAGRIAAELRQQYVIGFTPAHTGDGKFHKVQVTVNNCGQCRVRVRSGFIADKQQ